MNLASKPVIAGVGVGVLVILTAGYLYASSEGVERFEDFLYEHDLRDAIRYDDADYSPLSDTITLTDVELDIVVLDLGGGNSQKVTGRMKSLALEGASDEDKRRISFSGYGLATDPSESELRENVLYQLLAEPLRVVRQMGIDETSLDGSVAYDYDRDDKTLGLSAYLSAEKVASVELSLALDRARKLVESELSSVVAESMMNPMKPLQDFGKIELVSFDAKVRDFGFIENMAYVQGISRFNYSQALNNEEPIEALKPVKVDEKTRLDVEGVIDQESVEAMGAFLSKGGDLDLSISTERPVALASLIRDDKPHRDIRIEIRR